MPAKDILHEAVKSALRKDGWTIKNDPLHLKWGRRDFYVDLAAEKFLLAEKGDSKIAVEVKSFIGTSLMQALEQALGQFLIYRAILNRTEPERELYLAVSEEAFQGVFAEDIGQLVIEDYRIPLIVLDEEMEIIVVWKL